MPTDKEIESYIYAMIVTVLGATTSFLVSDEKSMMMKLKTWAGGCTAGGAGALICYAFEVKQGPTLAICVLLSSFVATLWPIIGKKSKDAVEKFNIKNKDDGTV